jgi:GTP-binding protein HflX
VAAFRATLEGINEADIILHVIDITHPNARQQNETVMETLRDLDLIDRPMVVALNKVDLLPGGQVDELWLSHFPEGVATSARERRGLDALLARIEAVLTSELVYLTVQVPYERGDLAALFHQRASMVEESHNDQGTTLTGYLPRRWLQHFRTFMV